MFCWSVIPIQCATRPPEPVSQVLLHQPPDAFLRRGRIERLGPTSFLGHSRQGSGLPPFVVGQVLARQACRGQDSMNSAHSENRIHERIARESNRRRLSLAAIFDRRVPLESIESQQLHSILSTHFQAWYVYLVQAGGAQILVVPRITLQV